MAWTVVESRRPAADTKTQQKINKMILKEYGDVLSALLCRSKLKIIRNGLQASDFGNNEISVNFDDGSFAVFKHARVFLLMHSKTALVFTEHCGYFVFSMLGLRSVEETDPYGIRSPFWWRRSEEKRKR